MFKIDETLLRKIRGAISGRQLAPADGNYVFGCFGCSSECVSSCAGGCKGNCSGGCLGSCSGSCLGCSR